MLTKKRSASQYLGKSSTRDYYTQWLLSECNSSVWIVTKHAQFPVRAVSYAAAVIHNKINHSSPTNSKLNEKDNSVSSLTAPSYQEMIDVALKKQQTINNQAMQKLSDKIKNLNNKMEAYQKSTIDTIVAGITDTEKLLFVTGKVFQEKFAIINNKMTLLIEKISAILDQPVKNQPAKITAKQLKKQEATIMDIDHHL